MYVQLMLASKSRLSKCALVAITSSCPFQHNVWRLGIETVTELLFSLPWIQLAYVHCSKLMILNQPKQTIYKKPFIHQIFFLNERDSFNSFCWNIWVNVTSRTICIVFLWGLQSTSNLLNKQGILKGTGPIIYKLPMSSLFGFLAEKIVRLCVCVY